MATTIIDKIRKLLALANNNSNAHEAAQAAARAQQLMLEHKIAALDLEASPDDADADEVVGETDIVRGATNLTPWRRELLGVLSGYCFCQTIFMKPGRSLKRATIRVVGLPEDAALLAELYAYLQKEINRLLGQEGGNKKPRAWRVAFRRGAVAGIGHTMDEQAKMQMSDSRALVVYQRSKEKVDQFVQQNFRNLTFTKSRAIARPDAAAVGFRAGKTINIKQPGGAKPKLAAGGQ